MFTRDDRRDPMRPEVRRSPLADGLAAMAMVLVLACSSNNSSGTGAGGGSAPGGHAGGAGGDSGSGGSGAGGRGGGTGNGGGGSGGLTGTGGVLGTGGHDISPVVCGNALCPLTYHCCIGCNGAPACAPACTGFVCPDAGAGGSGGTGPADAAQPDAAGSLACGTMTCGLQQACVHPPGPGTCLMPDGGQCPSGTSLSGGCCLPPLIPSCVAIDRPCSGPTVTCACFSVNPCSPQLCAGASFQGRVVMCHGA